MRHIMVQNCQRRRLITAVHVARGFQTGGQEEIVILTTASIRSYG